ncbi:Na+/H+ antiporter NhaC [Halioglobus japonicus]|uniref:Na+/H+ antiporter NhaC n=1 Tax=Halioglobus japonicus TaxID=930805 RepID=A0AAP8MBW2_9GAMM|nr:Na+/H+ antiporter NhaC [Halioglobus japonicus]AQA16874.1 Na+/H+ antiporter NhaC [Halioglobus japonicus]PLW84757.1 Na+/H+ antiporter NhaC [Halioglobus japonicus]GHD21260.1 Na+/H+ antiporter NhaC [Halioglobus japonicus]
MIKTKDLSLFDAMIIAATLVVLLGGAIALFGSDALQGATQIALMLTGFVGAVIGMKNGLSWNAIEANIVKATSRTIGTNLIFLSIGSLIGSLMLSGSVPTLLYVGLNILSAEYFYPLCCLICALTSLCIGSSWTTAATVGVGLIGVAYGFSLSPEITAGAVISGAYFGDKMSPLSETTNLAPAVTGSELFSHIRHMTWVSIPSFIISVVLFAIVGLTANVESESQAQVERFLVTLDSSFNIAWYNLIPIVFVLVLAIKRVPALLAITAGTLLACLFATLFQQPTLSRFVNDSELGQTMLVIKGLWLVLFDGFVLASGNEDVDSLLSRGGMSSMVNMVWLVLSSMMMAGVMEKVGFIQLIMRGMVSLVRSTGSLIATTMTTCIGVNVLTGDQYLSLVLPGQMWQEEYRKRNLDTVNLSRTLEDAGTLTSPLIPWNACGVFMAGTLAVATLSYLPYCFFNLINPVIALVYGYANIKIKQLDKLTPEPESPPRQHIT